MHFRSKLEDFFDELTLGKNEVQNSTSSPCFAPEIKTDSAHIGNEDIFYLELEFDRRFHRKHAFSKSNVLIHLMNCNSEHVL